MGVTLSILPIIIKLQKDTLGNVFFNKAFDTLYIALFARRYNLVIFYSIILLLLSIMIFLLKNHKSEPNSFKEEFARLLSSILLGYILIELYLYTQLDNLFFRSVFISIPFYIGSILLLVVFINISTDKDLTETISSSLKKKSISFDLKFLYTLLRLSKIILIFLMSLNLIFSNLGMAGYLPTPPDKPTEGFGTSERPYEVTRIKIAYELPEEVRDYVGPINDSEEFYSYIYVPDIQNINNASLPVVLGLHGIGSWDLDLFYDEIMTVMASRGSIAIFTQYPYYVDLEGPFVQDDNDPFGYSSYAYILYTSLWKGIQDTIEYMFQKDVNDFSELLGDNTIDLDNMLIMGHSYGGGMAPYIAYKAIEEGWGSNQLIIDQEAPAYTNFWEGMKTNFSVYPENTIVNLNVYNDDFRFPMCYTIHEFALYKQSSIPKEQIIFSMIRSDLYGFPRLVATHYTPNDPTMDSLSYYGIFRRVDAMVGYLFGLSNNDISLMDSSLPLFTTKAMLDMGNWSDGTSVKPMLMTYDAYELKDEFNNLDEQSCIDDGLI